MRIAVPREPDPRERRVAVTPDGVRRLVDLGHDVLIEHDAGRSAGHGDDDYRAAGATVADPGEVVGSADLVVALDPHVVAAAHPPTDDAVLVGLLDPLWDPDRCAALARPHRTLLGLELIPRTTRAQRMDVLSSMATVAGTEAVLVAARTLPRMFPLMMTAAGTVPAAKVLVLGAGVAGLQAVATARRLGAVVSGYDVRPAAAEQIRSLGAKSIELDLTDGTAAEDSGGYARAQDEDTADRQRRLLADHVADADVVITTAAIPGAASPLLVTTDAVAAMRAGSVVVDLAAERGGNCEPTRADEEVVVDGVTVLGPTDLPSGSAATASQLFTTNVLALLDHLTDDEGTLVLDVDDEITAGVLVARDGVIVHPRLTPPPDAEDHS